MRHRGWLLDPYISGRNAIYWFKTTEGRAVKVEERHNPIIVVKPNRAYTVDNVVYLLETHPYVLSASPITRYTSIHRDMKAQYVEVKIDTAEDLDEVTRYAESLYEVEELYNVGLIPIQWHLIYKGVQPSTLCDIEEINGRLNWIKKIDDSESIYPPPWKPLFLKFPYVYKIDEVKVLNQRNEEIDSIKGKESVVLQHLNELILEEDPDIIVTEDPRSTTRHVLSRARSNNIEFCFGRSGERYHGRIIIASSSYRNTGLVGLIERARFTYAPIGLSAEWEPGKTIDSRQCAEAVKMCVVVPGMNGGYGFKSSAWDMIRSDRGGMIFSPKPGLHENVAALDFESMFPNIIIHKNVSYETVTEEGIDASKTGFMGGFMNEFLTRRLKLKHRRDRLKPSSREWLLCQQRQAALKLMLVVVYGYSGCYSNRFANVRVFQEINRLARQTMVKALRIAQGNGYNVIYGPFDSLFVKKNDASRGDYVDLAAQISDETSLPMNMENHFKYLVLLTKTTDPVIVAANRYYGKLMDDRLFYRGIELRRHDTPKYIFDMQLDMINTLFRHESKEQVETKGVEEAHSIASNAIRNIRLGKADPETLIISKRLRRELRDYEARQPHIVAALLGRDTDVARYILMNTKSPNPYLRVMPASMRDKGHKGYDKKKYTYMVRRAAWNLLRPFVLGEQSISSKSYKRTKLDYFT
jgi:DNA polymerase elongation subunit (family B)